MCALRKCTYCRLGILGCYHIDRIILHAYIIFCPEVVFVLNKNQVTIFKTAFILQKVLETPSSCLGNIDHRRFVNIVNFVPVNCEYQVSSEHSDTMGLIKNIQNTFSVGIG